LNELRIPQIAYEELFEKSERYQGCSWIDFSWQGVEGESRNSAQQHENILREKGLARLAKASRAEVYIGVGSQAEYGPVEGAIPEIQAVNPTTQYGRAKNETRLALKEEFFGSNTRFIWARVFSTYGPGDSEKWLIPSLAKSLMRGSQLSLTKCEQLWDYLYVTDAARAFVCLAEGHDLEGIFNVGSGITTPLKDIVNEVARLVNPSFSLRFGEEPYRKDQVMHLQADISRITRLTGWLPQTQIREGIRKTVLELKLD
jgi:nucleoside-diphosphate-sugar epimerase